MHLTTWVIIRSTGLLKMLPVLLALRRNKPSSMKSPENSMKRRKRKKETFNFKFDSKLKYKQTTHETCHKFSHINRVHVLMTDYPRVILLYKTFFCNLNILPGKNFDWITLHTADRLVRLVRAQTCNVPRSKRAHSSDLPSICLLLLMSL